MGENIKRVLIGSLGETAEIITETLDCFREDDKPIDYVRLVATSGLSVKEACKSLEEHLFDSNCPICSKHYRNIDLDITEIDSEDIATADDNDDFLRQLLDYINSSDFSKEQDKGNRIEKYLSLSGGRKHMSALVMLGGMISSVDGIYHVTIKDSELEDAVHKRQEDLNWHERNPALGWHYPNKDSVKFVPNSLIGKVPFIEALLRILGDEEMNSLEQRKRIEALKSEGHFEEIKSRLDGLLWYSFEKLTPIKIVRMMDGYRNQLLHDCIKRGPVLSFDDLHKRWQTCKKGFAEERIWDPEFENIDKLFQRQDSNLYNEFKAICKRLDIKLKNRIKEIMQRCESLTKFIQQARDNAYGSYKAELNELKKKDLRRSLPKPEMSPSQIVNICGDETLKSCFMELILNALRYSVSTQKPSAQKPEVKIEIDKHCIRIYNTGTRLDSNSSLTHRMLRQLKDYGLELVPETDKDSMWATITEVRGCKNGLAFNIPDYETYGLYEG